MIDKCRVIFVLALLICLNANGQEKEIFPGENKLAECRVNLPLTYKNKDRPVFEKTASEFKDVKLVLLQYDKKSRLAKYRFYYVLKDNSKDQVFVYLETPESHDSTNGKKQVIFLKFRIKSDRFYRADCFMEILNQNSDLNKIIQTN